MWYSVHTATYSYDTLNRLTSSVAQGSQTQNLTFTYDRWGNMTCPAGGSGCPPLSYNTTTNQITTFGTQTFTYDAAGNLTGDGTGVGTHTYNYDAEGRVISIVGNAGGPTTTNVFNALGQRVRQTQTTPSADWYYAYDTLGHVTGVWENVSQQWQDIQVWAGDRVIAKYDGTSTYFVHSNLLGSTTGVTNQTGTLVQDQLYYPWGQPWTGVSSTQEDIRFASLRELEVAGIYTTPNRGYSSPYGRWLTPDPAGGDITNPQSLNRYAYVMNDPTNLIDPLGLGPCGESDTSCNAYGVVIWDCSDFFYSITHAECGRPGSIGGWGGEIIFGIGGVVRGGGGGGGGGGGTTGGGTTGGGTTGGGTPTGGGAFPQATSDAILPHATVRYLTVSRRR